MFVFFELYGDHRDLHSFPTRRTSDLPFIEQLGRLGLPSHPADLGLSTDEVVRVLLAAPQTRPDRKSTRLNSSHANISYAVFCLKKKRYTTPRYTESSQPETPVTTTPI